MFRYLKCETLAFVDGAYSGNTGGRINETTQPAIEIDILTGCRGGSHAEMGNILLRSLSAKARKVSYKEDKFVRPIEQGLPYEDIFLPRLRGTLAGRANQSTGCKI